MPASIHAFAEKVALVINGSEGIGRAVALQLALQGSYVIVSYTKQSAQQLNALEELKSLGTLASAFEFIDAENLLSEAANLFGRLDLLINCLDPKLNHSSRFRQSLKSLPHMHFRPKPAIVNVISKPKNYFYQDLPPNFRQNNVIVKKQKNEIEHNLFSVNNYDDTARVVLFFLSSEAKALNQQILYIN